MFVDRMELDQQPDSRSNEELEERIRELLSDLAKHPTAEVMIRFQLTELARQPGGRVKIRRLLADVLDASADSSRRTETASGESIN